MTAPTVAQTASTLITTGATTHACNLPTGGTGRVVLVVGVGRNQATPGVSFPGDWTETLDIQVTTPSGEGLAVAYKDYASAPPSTINITTTNTTRCVAYAFRLTGYNASSAPEAATATGTSDPPNLSPSWGSDDCLVVTGCVQNADYDAANGAWPYASNQLRANTGINWLGVCSTTGTASSFNPATWSAAEDSFAVATVVVRGAASGTNASAGNATGTGAGNAPTASVAPATGSPAGTGTANASTLSVKPVAGTGSGTGTVDQASFAVSTSAAQPSGTGLANQAAVGVAPPAGLAAATGQAATPTISVAPSPPALFGVGTAFDPTVQTGAFTDAAGGHASGTATANPASILLATAAGTATGLGVAAQPALSIASPAVAAAAAGLAFGAAVAVTKPAPADYAAGTGVALDAKVLVSVGAQTAAAAGIAWTAAPLGDSPDPNPIHIGLSDQPRVTFTETRTIRFREGQ